MPELDKSHGVTYVQAMEAVKKAPNDALDAWPSESKRSKLLTLIHPGVIVGVSLLLAGAIFLTGPDLRSLVGTDAALYKLLAGSVLISILGMFFAQRLIMRESAAGWRFGMLHDKEDVEAMASALLRHVDVDAERRAYDEFDSRLRRKI